METLAEPLSVDMAHGFSQMAAMPNSGPPVPVGHTAIGAIDGIITAQRVAVPRHIPNVMQRLKTMAAMRGEAYVYSWEVNDRRNGRKQTISGPTIKLANDLLREYGNCMIKIRVDETPTHWIIIPRFIDLETGFGYERPFQQRKSQDTGMRDADRQADLVFQIGVSKAIRNVTVNALSTYVDFMVEEAQAGMVQRFADDENRKKALTFIDKVMDHFNIAPVQVEAVIGRKRDKWSVKDLVRVYTEMRGIADGLTIAEDVYPSVEDARIVEAEKKTKDEEGRKPVAKPKVDAKPEPTADEKRAAEDKALEIPANLRRTGDKTPAEAEKPTDPPPQKAETNEVDGEDLFAGA